MVLYLHKNRGVYKSKKYLNVRGDDAFDVNPAQAGARQREYARLSTDHQEGMSNEEPNTETQTERFNSN